jgi:hypothetical protein
MLAALNLGERLTLSGLLGAHRNNYATLKIVREFREELSLTELELKKHNVINLPDGSLKWDDGESTVEFDFSPKILEIARTELETLNERNDLDLVSFCLYDKLVAESPGEAAQA